MDKERPGRPATRADLFVRLASLGIATRTVEHPPLHTVEESRRLRGEIPGAHTKNLFLKCRKGRLWLVVALEDAEIDLKGLHRLIGAGRLSFGDAALLQDTLGVPPGAVTPFAAINDREGKLSILLDSELMRHDPLNFHPLENNATTSIAPEDLLAFLSACGHEPRILPLSAQARARAAGGAAP